MPDTDINASRLGWNIKCLREFYGETLSDLMNAIGANSTGPISYYESGKQIPNRDTLLKIAKHYKVTLNELLYGDFNQLNTISISDLQTNGGFLIIEYLLPIVSSSRAIENTWFLLAHKLHTYLFLLLKNGKTFGNKLSCHCVDFYKKAEADGVPEATANLLWWLFIEGITILGITPYVLKRYTESTMNPPDIENYIKNYCLWKVEDSNDDDVRNIEDARNSYIKEIEPEYIRLLKILNQYPDYVDLAAYYSALRYYLGLVDNGLAYEMNAVVGRQMLISLGEIGNKYASIFSDDVQE